MIRVKDLENKLLLFNNKFDSDNCLTTHLEDRCNTAENLIHNYKDMVDKLNTKNNKLCYKLKNIKKTHVADVKVKINLQHIRTYDTRSEALEFPRNVPDMCKYCKSTKKETKRALVDTPVLLIIIESSKVKYIWKVCACCAQILQKKFQ